MSSINEKFSKRLFIFYHPIFQDIIDAWSTSFTPTKSNLDMLTFIELNIRIQKAMISSFDFQNSLSSALTDWYKELDDLDVKKINKNLPNTNKSQAIIIKPNINHIIEAIDSLPFTPSITLDKYINHIKSIKTHIAFKYTEAKLSLIGFCKFLFDLCISWCENLDIELFMLFLIGLLLQITEGPTIEKSILIKTDYITALPPKFFNQMKVFKTHYERYKKQDLLTFQSWYEWNYLPTRLKEIINKIIDTLKPLYSTENYSRFDDLNDLFDKIMKKHELDTMNVTERFGKQMKFFEQLLFQDSHDSKNLLVPNLLDITNNDKTSKAENPEPQVDIERNGIKHATVIKKLCMPIFGKSFIKQQLENAKQEVHTIKNHSLFLDNAENDDAQADYDAIYTGLYPIWEKGELSDTLSNKTIVSEKGSKGFQSGCNMTTTQSSSNGDSRSLSLQQKDDKSPRIKIPQEKNAVFEWSNEKIKKRGKSMIDSSVTKNLPKNGDFVKFPEIINTSNQVSSIDNSFDYKEENMSKISKLLLEDHFGIIQELKYLNDSENNTQSQINEKDSLKFKASFLSKNYDPLHSPQPDISLKIAELRKANRKHSYNQVGKPESQHRIDVSYIKERKHASPAKLNLQSQYTKKTILTSSAKQNAMNLIPILDKSFQQNKKEDFEKLAIILDKQRKNNDYLETKTKIMASGSFKRYNQNKSLNGISSTLNDIHSNNNSFVHLTNKNLKANIEFAGDDFISGLDRLANKKYKKQKEHLQKIQDLKKGNNDEQQHEYIKLYPLKSENNFSGHEIGSQILEKNESPDKIENLLEYRPKILEKKREIEFMPTIKPLRVIEK